MALAAERAHEIFPLRSVWSKMCTLLAPVTSSSSFSSSG